MSAAVQACVWVAFDVGGAFTDDVGDNVADDVADDVAEDVADDVTDDVATGVITLAKVSTTPENRGRGSANGLRRAVVAHTLICG